MPSELALLLTGDRKIVLEFYRKYAPKILNYLKRRLARPEDAQEILNDVFLDALDSLHKLRPDSNLQSFLFTIAHNKMVDFYRKKKIKSILFSQVPYLEFAAKEIHQPEFQMEKEKVRMKIEKVMQMISAKYAMILQMHYEKGMRIKEIAIAMNLSFKATESLLFRARQQFIKLYLTA